MEDIDLTAAPSNDWYDCPETPRPRYVPPRTPIDALFWRTWQAADSAGAEVQHLLSEYHHARARQVAQLQAALSALLPRAEAEGAPELPGSDLRAV